MAEYTLSAKLTADASKFQEAFKRAQETITNFQKKAKTIADSLESIGSKISSMGGKITAFETAAVGAISALGGSIIKTGAEFQQGMANVKAISGATTEELEQLTEKAKEMGAKTKFSASQAADAFSYMAMAGWKTQDMIGGIEGIMNLAAASGEDLALTSDIVTDALTAFGMSASESGHFADVLAAASSNANTNVAMMGETFKYAAPVAGSLGYSCEDTAVAVGLMANAGIKASQAGTSLRQIMSRVGAPVGKAAKALEQLGISATDSEGNVKPLMETMLDLRGAFSKLSAAEKTSYAKTIAGADAYSGLLTIVNASEADFNKLTNAVYNCDGVCESMAETMNNTLSGQFTILKSQIEGIQLVIFEMMEDRLMNTVKALQKGATAVHDFVSRFSELKKQGVNTLSSIASGFRAVASDTEELPDCIIQIAKKFRDLTYKIEDLQKAGVPLKQIAIALLAIGPGLLVFGKMLTLAGKVTKVFASMAGTISMLANPIGIIAVAVVGLTAGIVHLYKTNETFRTVVTGVWEDVKTTILTAKESILKGFDGFGEEFTPIWQSVKSGAVPPLDGLKQAFSLTFDSIKDSAEIMVQSLIEKFAGVRISRDTLWSDIGTQLQNSFSGFTLENVRTEFEKAKEKMSEFLNMAIEKFPFLESVIEKISSAFSIIKSVVQTVWDVVSSFISGFTSNFSVGGETLVSFGSLLLSVFTGGNPVISLLLGKILEFSSSISELVGKIGSELAPVFESIGETIGEVLSTIFDTLGTVFGEISPVIGSVIQSVIQVIGEILPVVVDIIKQVFPVISDLIKQLLPLIGKIVSAFSQILQCVVPLVSELISSLLPVISEIVGIIMDLVSSLLPALIPIIESLIDTIVQIAQAVLPVVVDLIKMLLPFITQIVGVVSELVKAIAPLITQLVETLMPVIVNIVNIVMNLIEALMPAITAILNVIMSLIEALMPVIETILTVVVNVISTIIDVLNPIISIIAGIIETIVAIITPIITFIADLIATIIQYITPIIEFISNVIQTIWKIISDICSKISEFISNVITKISGIIGTISSTFSNIFNKAYGIVKGVMDKIKTVITTVFDKVKSAWDGLTGFVGGVFDGIKEALSTLINGVKGVVNAVISGINFAIDAINLLPGVNISPIQYLAHGTDNWQGGFAYMNEGGRGELVNLPNGSQVIPHDVSVKYAREAARQNVTQTTIIDYDYLINGLASAMSEMRVQNIVSVDGNTVADVIAPAVNKNLARQAMMDRRRT